MSDSKSGELAKAKPEEGEDVLSKTPTKRTPKRKADAFQKESEELLKNLGVSVDVDDGRRRTRSSARGGAPATPTATPAPATPPAKKARGAATPKRGAGQGKQEDEDPEEETHSPKSTPKKRGPAAAPKKLMDVAEDPTKQDGESGADNTDAAVEKNETNEVSEDATKAPVDKSKKESQPDVKDETTVQKDGKPASKKEDSVGDAKSDSKPDVEPMEVVEQDAESSTEDEKTPQDKPSSEKAAVEAKPSTTVAAAAQKDEGAGTPATEAAKEAHSETVESNGNADSTATAPQQPETPEKAVVSSDKDSKAVDAVTEKKEPSVAVEQKTSPAKESVGSTTQEVVKTTTTTVNNVDSTTPTENNVTENVSSNVESKIVTNETAAVEPATAP